MHFINVQNSKGKAYENIKYICIDKIPVETSNVIEAAKYIVDNMLPNKSYSKEFYLVSFSKGTSYLMIAQKLDSSKGYASFILFGYGINTMVYRTEYNGVWRE